MKSRVDAKWLDDVDDEEKPDEEIEVPSNKVKLIIGAGGENIKKIQKKSKCRLQAGTFNRPITVYCLGESPIHSLRQSVSARRGRAGARLNAHEQLRTKRQRSAREAIYRNRRIVSLSPRLECSVCQSMFCGFCGCNVPHVNVLRIEFSACQCSAG